jgi:hypothetical protein
MAATFGSSGSGNFNATPATRPQAMRELVKLDARPAWWYIHHPARWTYADGEWVPWLTTLAADPGVANVDKNGNMDLAEVTKRRAGWTLIPWDAEPGGYCVAYEGAAGAVHLSKWERPKLVANQTRIEADTAGYWAFCRRLVADGYIDRPDPSFIDIQIERQATKVAEWREKAPSSPFHREALVVEEGLLENMRAAMELLYAPVVTDDEAPAAPAPKPRRGRA